LAGAASAVLSPFRDWYGGGCPGQGDDGAEDVADHRQASRAYANGPRHRRYAGTITPATQTMTGP
ncbi:hypothetical protein, partial [Streptomyces sp. MBT72]|uniref:hypothetical protein n=1 Tax=Streptomyces sp. MBT72 TaxID=1488402 RepID=UPI001F489E87